MESNEKLEELLKRMYAQESLHDDDIDTNDIINEEWTKFEAEHYRSKRQPFFFKIAAMFISVLMLGGIAYATIHLFEKQEIRGKKQETTVVANSTPSTLHSTLAEQDNALQQSIVYEDKELSTILNDIATFYQVECVYKNEEVKHVRLYFTWDKQQTIDEVIDMFNKFERFHISRNSQKLIVE